MDHTVLSANTPCLPFLRKRSPDVTIPNSGRSHPIAAYSSSIDPKEQGHKSMLRYTYIHTYIHRRLLYHRATY